MICAPRVLIEADPSSRNIELGLLANGFDHPDAKSFGLQGVASGYASWSGVAYCPTDTERALRQDEIVAAELEIQANWSYCGYIAETTENRAEPQIPDGYGYRFLRACKSRLLPRGRWRRRHNGPCERQSLKPAA